MSSPSPFGMTMTDPYIQTIAELVSIPSCSHAGGGDEQAIQAYVAQQFCDAGARVRSIDTDTLPGFREHPLCCGPQRNYANRPTVLGEIGPANADALLVLAHCDTVSVNNAPDQWTVTAPFTPLVKNGWLYGRGACDDKWGVACLIHILRQLQRDAAPLRRRVMFASTIDEENGVGNGLLALHLAGLDVGGALYLDGTGGALTIGNLGGSNLNIDPPSNAAESTIYAFANGLATVCKEMSAARQHLFTGIYQRNDAAARSVRFAWRGSNRPMINFYTAPNEDGAALSEYLETTVRQLLGAAAEEWQLSYRMPWFQPTLLPVTHPLVTGIAASYKTVYGHAPTVTTVSKQDSFVLRQHGVPTVGFGPGNSTGQGAQHVPDEGIEIAAAQAALRFAYRAVTDWLRNDEVAAVPAQIGPLMNGQPASC